MSQSVSAAAGWVCPSCARRVPGAIGQCRCGYERADAVDDSTTDDDESRSRRVRSILEGLLLLLAIAGVGYYYYAGSSAPRASVGTKATAIPPPVHTAPPAATSTAASPAPVGIVPSAIAGTPARAASETSAASRPAQADGTSSLEDIVSRAMPALVRVETGTGFGSGFFVQPDTVLTNVHVVAGNAFVNVKKPDGSSAVGRVESTAPDFDIAVLKIANADPSQPVLAMGSGVRVRPGQEIVALGTPLGLQNTVTRGIVSALRQVGPVSLVQTDAAINPGNSGGPLLDRSGQVVAIATMSVRPGVGQGLSFGVAIDHARALLEGRLNAQSTGSPSGGLNQLMSRPPAAPSAPADASEPSSADDARQLGARTFEQAISRIARTADALDSRWQSFVKVCYRGNIGGGFDRPWFAVFDPRALQGTVPPGCEQAFEDIKQNAARIRDDVHEADESARRSGVFPGARRDVLRRLRLDYAGWDR